MKWRGRVLRDSTMSMPRSRGGRARVHDRDAARQNRPQHAGRRARRQDFDAAAFGERAVVAHADRLDARRRPSARRWPPADRPAGSTAAAAAARRDGPTGSSPRCGPRRRAGNRGPWPPCRGRPVPALPRSTPRCAASRPPAAVGRATNRPAAPSRRRRARRRRRCRFRSRARSAASSISSPRAVLMMRMPGLHTREPLVVEQVLRFRRRRQVQRQVVGDRAQLVERQQLDAEPAAISLRDERIVRDDPHPERARAHAPLPGRCGRGRRCRASCRAARCRETASSPTCRPSSPDRRRAPMRASASISAHACSATLMLLAPGALTTRMPRRAGGGDVDVVDAGAGAADDAQPRRGGEQLLGDLRRAADQQRRRRPRDRVARSAGLAPGSGVDVPAFRAEQFERRRRQLVGDDDFQ